MAVGSTIGTAGGAFAAIDIQADGASRNAATPCGGCTP
jgi:hypothetical protein